ncbi:MAG: hypothetical protein M0Q21_09315 [Ignavibacteriaceae bacterium]|nr:hypothetical protein [Ignavibacteriaceae bacterium]
MKNKAFKLSLVVLIYFSASQLLLAQKIEYSLTGKLHSDSKILFENSKAKTQNISFQSPNKKSPIIAGLLSLALPGAGEVYAESYWKAVIFAAVEVSAIVVAVSYNKKGDNQTSTFQQYADGHWSIKRYAEWTIKNISSINDTVHPIFYGVISSDGSVNHSELNRLERNLGNGYSHALPQHGDQQYYELIGKYPQYSGGWDDKEAWEKEHPEQQIDFHILSQRFYDYSKMRGQANDYYNISDKAVIGIYINHLLSGLDAVWSAISFNQDVAVSVRVNPINTGENVTFYPTVSIRFAF